MDSKKSNLQKNLIAMLVVVVLIALPAGSWYYLSIGLEYRKEALADLEPKGEFKLAYSNYNISEMLIDATTIVVENEQLSGQESFIDELLDQYGKSKTFQVVSVQTNMDTSYIESDSTQLYYKLYIQNELPRGIAQYSIVDTSGLLRGIYQTDPASMRKLIEHAAIILPRVKEVDIKTNR